MLFDWELKRYLNSYTLSFSKILSGFPDHTDVRSLQKAALWPIDVEIRMCLEVSNTEKIFEKI